MAEYLTPGVYMEDIKSVVNMPTGTDPVAAFVGVTASGPVGVPTAISSWTDYLNIFATGQETAFLANSYLAYAVYGFFQNGGRLCYITRVTKGTVSGSSVTFSSASAKTTGSDDFSKAFSAKSEGTWGNKITVVIPQESVDETTDTFTVQVKYNNKVVETFTNLKKGVNVPNCFADIINSESIYVSVTNVAVEAPLSTLKTSGASLAMSGGDDGLESSGTPVPDNVYEAVLTQFDYHEDIRLVAIPGASDDLTVKLATYCTGRKYVTAICEGQVTATDAQLQTLRANLNGTNAVLYAPWIKITNPLSSSGSLIAVPACGHVCGVYSRINETRGFWKAPAGTEATVRGAVATQRIFTQSQTDALDPKGINTIVSKTNSGICIWGARSCNEDLPYVSDLYTNLTIKKNLYDLTQRFVFEPHNTSLWTKVKATCQDYLNSLYERGAFCGDKTTDAYFVKCDETNNPESVRRQGKLVVEVGYATNKPAEFIVFRISHELTNNA